MSGGRRSSRAVDLGAHQPQRLDDPVDRAPADRLVAVEGPLALRLPGQPARQDAQQGAGVADVDRAAGRAPRSPTPRIRKLGAPAPPSLTSAPSARTASSVERVSAASR